MYSILNPSPSEIDEAKSLGDAAIRAYRLAQLSENHIAPLTAFVRELRST